jgi:AmmeMemoRadiSam system protein A
MGKFCVYVLGLILLNTLLLCQLHAGCGRVWAASSISPEDQATLRLVARATVNCVVRGEKIPSIPIDSERLKERRGAFVTLTRGGHLRGCIGSLVGTLPLHEMVQKMAIRAATCDPRFPPVRAHELPSLEIEISVLGPLTPIQRVEDIVVGTHGLLLIHGEHSGVLLPQVASEYGWDRHTFLENLSQKAGLPKDAWKSQKAEIYAFTAEVF